MTRHTKNSMKAPILEDDESGLEELGNTPTDGGDVSVSQAPAPTPPSTAATMPTPASTSPPAIINRRSDEPTEAHKKRFEDTWDFQPLIDELESDTSKPKTSKAKKYFDTYFKAVPISTQTLLLFERWAGLTNDNDRSDQMRELIGLLHGRWSGHRGSGISIGIDPKAKDENLRADLLKLLKGWYLHEDFGDDPTAIGDENEAVTQETGVAPSGETSATEHATELSQRTRLRQQSMVSTSTRNGYAHASKPRDSAAVSHSPEERTLLERTILENWADHAATVPDHLPDFIGPAGLPWQDWPFDILEAIVGLSSVTRARDNEVISAKLQGLAPNARTYSRPRSLNVLNAARDYYDKGKDTHSQPYQQDGTPAGADHQSVEKKRPCSRALSGQRPQKQPRTAATKYALAHARPSRPGARPLHTAAQPGAPTNTLPQPRDTNTLKIPPGLSNSDKLRYRDLSFEIMEKDSQRCEAERLVDHAVAARSSACLTDDNRTFAALEAEVGERRAAAERLRGEIIGLQVQRWKIAGLGSENTLKEGGEMDEDGAVVDV